MNCNLSLWSLSDSRGPEIIPQFIWAPRELFSALSPDSVNFADRLEFYKKEKYSR